MNFGAHVALLREFLDRREPIVAQIESRLLNARATGGRLGQMLDACFFAQPGLPPALSHLKGQLADSHLADGFEPIAFEGPAHDLDPAALTVLAHRQWDHQRWPGRNVRLRYAARLYSVFILRQLEPLSLRLWDEGNERAADRLRALQALLDRLNDGTIADALVRDARWLIQTAQGPLTRRLEPYFRVAERISASFTNHQRLEIHKAGAILTSGHLRSQLRHRASEADRPVSDPGVLAITRNSNSMDAALLVRDLVPLLEAYEIACAEHQPDQRQDLADAILQAVSADPELFLTRLDLLAPCTMIEDLFIQHAQGQPRYTPVGQAHRHLLARYAGLIGRHAGSLQEDAARLDPRQYVYSPFGLAYGFCADLLSNMALDTLMSRAAFGLTLEDMFASRGDLEHKRARANAWTVAYSDEWAAEIFDRSMGALQARAEYKDRANASPIPSARLFIESAPDGTRRAQEHCLTSDLQRALATGATAFPKGQLLIDRKEGRFLASAEADGKWFGISKVVLTLYTSQGQDALLTGIPAPVVETLRLTCPELVSLIQDKRD